MLFEPFVIKGMKLKNRIVMAPMCQYSSDAEGNVKDWHVVHYASRATGGVGLVIVEATAVVPDGRISPNDLGIWNDSHIEGLKKIADAVHSNGAKAAIQIGHAGRKSKAAGTPVAPSALRFDESYKTPEELNDEAINGVISAFAAAAGRAVRAGFDSVEIHAAHGYLISEFLSPLTNLRTDSYGKRGILLGEIVKAVKTELPGEMPLIVRISAEDYADGGNTADDLSGILAPLKDSVDLVDVSGGGVVSNGNIKLYPGYQLGNAMKIRNACGLPTIGGGLVTEGDLAEYALNSGMCDMIFLGRALLREPYWPLKAAKELGVDLEWPFQYERGKY